MIRAYTVATIVLKLVRQPVANGSTKISSPLVAIQQLPQGRNAMRENVTKNFVGGKQILVQAAACTGAKTLPDVEAKEKVQKYKRRIF